MAERHPIRSGRARNPRHSRRPARASKTPRKDPFGIKPGESWYGVATSLGILESQGHERRVTVGGVRRLFKRPAQRPKHQLMDQVSDQDLARLLSAFAHPQRVAIMKAIYTGAGTYAALRSKVGLKAGPMYHHLRELRLAGVLADGPRDVYRLTSKGRDALIIACSLGSILGEA